MDEIVRKIYSSLNEDDMLCIVSDHGMANEGGHGGTSKMEVITPMILISNSKSLPDSRMNDSEFLDLIENIKTFEQIDLVATLSCLHDLPVPSQNRGVAFINHLIDSYSHLDYEQQLELQVKAFKCLNANLLQLNTVFELSNEFKDNVRRLNKEFINEIYKQSGFSKKNLQETLRNLNGKLEGLIKMRMGKEKDVNHINQKQTFYLTVILVFMLNVLESCLLYS